MTTLKRIPPTFAEATIPLTDTFAKNVKPLKEAGDNYTDGGGVYLLVMKSGKYWRLNDRYADKRKTLALGGLPVR